MLMLRGKAQKQGISLSRQTVTGLWSCYREPVVKGDCTVTQATRDWRPLAAVA